MRKGNREGEWKGKIDQKGGWEEKGKLHVTSLPDANPGQREYGKMTTLRGLQQAGAGPHRGLTGQAIYGPSIGLVDPLPSQAPSLLISIYLFLGLFFKGQYYKTSGFLQRYAQPFSFWLINKQKTALRAPLPPPSPVHLSSPHLLSFLSQILLASAHLFYFLASIHFPVHTHSLSTVLRQNVASHNVYVT